MRSAPWADLQRRRPSWRAAGVRFLGSADLELPDGAPRGEAHRRPPDLDDWLALLEDYALRCLRPRSRARRASATTRSSAALRQLGFQLTRRGSAAAPRRSTGC